MDKHFDEKYVKTLLPKRLENSHKGTFGHVLNIAGSEFYTGAAYFSSVAPLKVGCGLSTLAAPDFVLKTVSDLSSDVILSYLKMVKVGINSNYYDVVSIGCGLSVNKNTIKFFDELIKVLNKLDMPVVIDADGLNILSLLKISKLPINTILTPHPKELSRLMSVSVEDILSQPEFWVKKCCEKYNCTTLLKLHRTLVADNGKNFYVNNTGNSALSHGGSGDVLTGMISGFLAQGMGCFEASILGVYLHGKTGEIAAEKLSEYSVLASDLLKYIPQSIKTIL
ncbi:MAG: NAD(P)H-hydrate dehydratase [bacterium]